MTDTSASAPERSGGSSAALGPATLQDHVDAFGMMPTDVARIQLACSFDELLEHVLSGDLDAVVVGGRMHFLPDQLATYGAEQRAEQARTLLALLPALRRAVHGYLSERTVTDDYATALEQGRPLICARRGATHLQHGLHMHAVAASLTALTAWIGAEVARRPHDVLSALPIGAALFDRLLTLEGIDKQHNVTPLRPRANEPDGPRRPVRVRDWVRIDTTLWPPKLPADIAEQIGQAVDLDGRPVRTPVRS